MADVTPEKAKIYFQIYAKLNSDILQGDAEGYGQQLLDGFLNIPAFKQSVIDTATEMQREDIAHKITTTPTPLTNRNDIAKRLVQAVDENDTAMLVDLLDEPATPLLSLSQLDMFWNAVGNMTAPENSDDANSTAYDSEVFTHIQADPRYVAYFDQYVSAHEITGSEIATLRESVVSAHEAAVKTIDTILYDEWQMSLFASSENLYFLVEKEMYDTLGDEYTAAAPNTIFTGLTPPEPLTPEELTVIKVPFNEVVYEPAAEPELEIVEEEPEIPDNVLTFNIISAAEEPAVPEPTIYKVVAGDNLWNIAKDTYGLTSYKDIMRAVDHIAYANGLEKGVDANWIKIGQDIILPTAEQITTPTASLDWKALDRNIALGTGPNNGGSAYAFSDRIAAAPSVN